MKIHPCGCTAYNGDQCYNCLNGFHGGCEKKCKTRNAKKPGLTLVFPRRRCLSKKPKGKKEK